MTHYKKSSLSGKFGRSWQDTLTWVRISLSTSAQFIGRQHVLHPAARQLHGFSCGFIHFPCGLFHFRILSGIKWTSLHWYGLSKVSNSHDNYEAGRNEYLIVAFYSLFGSQDRLVTIVASYRQDDPRFDSRQG